eukprot:RCo004219
MPPAKGNPEVSVEPVVALPTAPLPLWSCSWLRVGAGLPEPEKGPEGEDGEPEGEESPPAERPVGRAVCLRYVVATITTETRAMVDPRVFFEKLADFDEVKILEKMTVCNWYAGLEEPYSPLLRDQLANQPDSLQVELVAIAFSHKLRTLHLSLLKELQGLREDLDDAQPIDDPKAFGLDLSPGAVEHIKIFVVLQDFPTAVEHVSALHFAGVPLHAVIAVNSLAPMAAPPPKEPVEAQAGGKGKPGKKDEKKPEKAVKDKKKGATGGGSGGGSGGNEEEPGG